MIPRGSFFMVVHFWFPCLCCSIYRDIVIQDIMLDAKSGGKSKDYERSRELAAGTAAVSSRSGVA